MLGITSLRLAAAAVLTAGALLAGLSPSGTAQAATCAGADTPCE
jgi:hypothetical protein